MNGPDKNNPFPIANYDRLCYLKNIIKGPNIEVGDYTYYDDFDSVENFEKNVKYHFEFNEDKLIIGNFCMIASGVEFIMNGANHLTQAISTYPFSVFHPEWAKGMEGKPYPKKGDTIIGNDVWIGYKATIMSGIKIGNGSIIASKSLVVKDVPPYTIVGGNPGKELKKRFSESDIERLERLAWWNWDLDKITANVDHLTSLDISKLEEV